MEGDVGHRHLVPARLGASHSAAAAHGWGHAIEESLALLVPGAMLLLMGLYFRGTEGQLGPSRWPVWEVLVALGVIALVGGSLSILAEDDGTEGPGGRPYPEIIRAEPRRTRRFFFVTASPTEAIDPPYLDLPYPEEEEEPPIPSDPTGLLAFTPASSDAEDLPRRERRASPRTDPDGREDLVGGLAAAPSRVRPGRSADQAVRIDAMMAEIDDLEDLLESSRRRLSETRRRTGE